MMICKPQLRRQMRRVRSECKSREELDARIADIFLQSEIYDSAKQLLLYASFRSEADTYKIFDKALADGKEVFFPYCVPNTNELRFFRVLSRDELKKDAFDIPAPPVSELRLWHPDGPSVCVLPGLAFSGSGERLGYGRGYYDTFLQQANVCTVGLCYGFQIVEAVPTEPHDQRVQYLCTEKGMIPCSAEVHGRKEDIYE